ncbi:MAG: polyprenyl synthetase family protein [Solirubrobacteraceae bacterium]|nr:polyprenyl synthetase family protein [Solirubrobacteraceae bacterium]
MAGATAHPETAELVRAGGAHVPGLLSAIEERLRASAGGHGPLLAEQAGLTIAAGGKRLRPLLVVLSAGRPTDPRAADAVLRAGAAIELVHSATLVHDDVLDGAALRRGRATVVARSGRAMATATGDLLFARAFEELTGGGEPEAIKVLSRASSALARGELLQRADAWNPAVPLERYLRRCELKTAVLFEAACELGALAGGVSRAGLGTFGRRIGLAFQILDDVLDVSGPQERTGKQPGADLLDGTVTLPLIVARERDGELGRIDLRSIATAEQAARLCERIVATGALDAARERALTLVAEAKADLPAGLDDERRTALELVADGVVRRYS